MVLQPLGRRARTTLVAVITLYCSALQHPKPQSWQASWGLTALLSRFDELVGETLAKPRSLVTPVVVACLARCALLQVAILKWGLLR